jgi:hypothetical protein
MSFNHDIPIWVMNTLKNMSPEGAAGKPTDDERMAILIAGGVGWRREDGKVVTEPCALEWTGKQYRIVIGGPGSKKS